MVVFPNAKINLGLNVLRKRADGYHDIETVMCPVGWRDVLEVVPAKGAVTTLSVSGRAVNCPVEKNLVMRAWRALENVVGELPPVDIYLHKVIPDGAGLGGGSADASFALMAFNDLLSLGLDKRRLASVAAGLGADCPFFIYNSPMLATGTGIELAPIDVRLAGYTVAIVKPPVSVPTSQAYAGVVPQLPAQSLREWDFCKSPGLWRESVCNAFEPSVVAAYPEIGEVKTVLESLGAEYCSMSGSGAAVYGIYSGDCDNLAERVRKSLPWCDAYVGALE